MTDAERDALLIDCARGLELLIGRELGMSAVSGFTNAELLAVYASLQRAIAAHERAGIKDPHGLLSRPGQV